MATIEDALFTQLTTFAGLTALTAKRVYAGYLPQSPVLPAIVVQMISNVREEAHGGQIGNAKPRFQVTCWGDGTKGKAALNDVATQVRLAVMSMKGTIGGVFVDGPYNAGEVHVYEPETRRHGVHLDFFIVHREAVA